MTFFIGLALVIAGLVNGSQGDPFWRAFALIALGVAAVAFSEWRAFWQLRREVVLPAKEVTEQ